MRHPEYKIFNLIYLMFLNNKKKLQKIISDIALRPFWAP